MLNILRRKAQSVVIQAIVLIIAVVFIFWGVGVNLGNKRNVMATVNGEEIPYPEFKRTYDNAVDNMRLQFGGSIPAGFLDGLDLERQVLNQLIRAEIARQAGRDMGIKISDRSVQEEIQDMEAFQTGGSFDLQKYKAVLSQNRMNPTSFEEGMQRDLLLQRVDEAVRGFALVTDSQIRLRYDYANEQVRVSYVELKAEDFLDEVEIDDEALAAWYEDNKDNYLSEPEIKLQYLFFAYEDDLDQVEVSDDMLRARYEAEKERYFTPEQRRARHILFRVSETDDTATRAAKREEAEEVLELARQGGDFAELAKEYSEGPTAANGGDLGFFSAGSMVEGFDNAVFAMEPGEMSGIVETVFGYHIIKLEEVRPAATRPFVEVREEIADRVRRQRVKSLTFDRAENAYTGIIRSGSLANYREEHGEEIRQTGYFSRSEPPGPPVADPRFLETAFSLNEGELSSLVETQKGYAILFVDDIKAPEVPGLDAVRAQVTADYRQDRSMELAGEKADALLAGAREQESLAAAAGTSFTVKESPTIKRTELSRQQEVPAQVVQQAFALPGGDVLPEEPVAVGSTFYIFELQERRAPGQEPDEAEREQLAQELLAGEQDKLMDNWVSWRQSKADIWINEQFLR